MITALMSLASWYVLVASGEKGASVAGLPQDAKAPSGGQRSPPGNERGGTLTVAIRYADTPGEPLAGRAALEAKLRAAAAAANQPEIHLRPHPRARYEPVAAAPTSAQRPGLAKIGLVGTEQYAP